MSEEKFVLSKESAKGLQNLLRTRRDSNPQKLRAKNVGAMGAQVAVVRAGSRVGSSSPYWVGTVCIRNSDGTKQDYDGSAVYLASAGTTTLLREGAIYLAIRGANSDDGKPVFVVGEITNGTLLEVGIDRTNGPLLAIQGDQISMHRVESGKTHNSSLLETTDGELLLLHTVVDGSLVDTAVLQFICRVIQLIGTTKIIGDVEINGTPGANGTDGLGSVFEEGICTTVGAGTGPPGAAGANGADGADGAPGSVWRDGTGAPSSGLGINGDYYLDDATGNVYLKAAGSYSIVANIKGATGATGSTGSTGATGATGAGVPTGGSTGQALRKINGTDYNTEWFTIPAATAAATQANMESQASGVYVDPSVVRFSPSAAKAWLYVTMSGGTPTVVASYNISSITDNGVGDLTINFTIPFSAANYGISACCSINEAGTEYCNVHLHTSTAPAAGSCRVHIVGIGTQGALDVKRFGMCFFGDQ